jgi:hypothetical protein
VRTRAASSDCSTSRRCCAPLSPLMPKPCASSCAMCSTSLLVACSAPVYSRKRQCAPSPSSLGLVPQWRPVQSRMFDASPARKRAECSSIMPWVTGAGCLRGTRLASVAKPRGPTNKPGGAEACRAASSVSASAPSPDGACGTAATTRVVAGEPWRDPGGEGSPVEHPPASLPSLTSVATAWEELPPPPLAGGRGRCRCPARVVAGERSPMRRGLGERAAVPHVGGARAVRVGVLAARVGDGRGVRPMPCAERIPSSDACAPLPPLPPPPPPRLLPQPAVARWRRRRHARRSWLRPVATAYGWRCGCAGVGMGGPQRRSSGRCPGGYTHTSTKEWWSRGWRFLRFAF